MLKTDMALLDLKDALNMEIASLRVAKMHFSDVLDDFKDDLGEGLRNNLSLICDALHNSIEHIEKRIA
ncbi:MAG: hypothetical protein PHV55_08205 [Candidatus Omnitrophica bacterium]|nr:hypothetical protein [Candidatus Omnitrophota bacterium]